MSAVVRAQLTLGYFNFKDSEVLADTKMIAKETTSIIPIIIEIMTFLVVLMDSVRLLFSQMMSDGSQAS